jgi:histidine kinase/DNA gyrase B/HSP90-like ATPase
MDRNGDGDKYMNGDKKQKTLYAPPKAGAMFETLRGLGYSPETAIADIIDNSISAGADEVVISFNWESRDSSITILDNGLGMTDKELFSAMKLGEKSPLDDREQNDLGRFGIGLKTASFSQCRTLTAASKKNGITSCLRWDFDYLATLSDDGWFLLVGPGENQEKHIELLDSVDNGTLIIWSSLDRMITTGYSIDDFLKMIDSVEAHCSMVFHRYLERSTNPIKIIINGKRIKAWDPFMVYHTATMRSPTETINSPEGSISIEGLVLPHRDHLKTEEHKTGAGPSGWSAQQGFYIYRNNRMLLAGSWLGMGRNRAWTKEEAHKLARIRIDIPNTADDSWRIDVRKSTAKPPAFVEKRLMYIAEDIRKKARNVFSNRGIFNREVGGSSTVTSVWKKTEHNNGIRYRINRSHPAISDLMKASDDEGTLVDALLKIIEETVPVQRIWLDTAEAEKTVETSFSGAPEEEIYETVESLFQNMLKFGLTGIQAKQRLLTMEPFNFHQDIVNIVYNKNMEDNNE